LDDPNARDAPDRALNRSTDLPDANAGRASTLPVVDEALDVTALRIREREARHDPPCLCWIAVLDRRLEPLAERFGLLQLTPEPAE